MRTTILLIALTVVATAACGEAAPAATTASGTTYAVSGLAHAGPTCPVVQDPPDPACADRPVPDAGVLVLAADGTVVARTVTQADGSFTVDVPSGSYTVVFQPVQGLMGTAVPQEVVVVDGPVTGVDGAYDTGIR